MMLLDIPDTKGHQPTSNSFLLMSENKEIFYPVFQYKLTILHVWGTYIYIDLERLLHNL